MSDLDKLGRRHAAAVRSALADAEPPPLETLTPVRRPPVVRGVLVALGAATLVAIALAPLTLLGPSPSPTATDEAGPETGVSPPETIGVPRGPFDFNSFLASVVESEFFRPDGVAERVALIVLVPEDKATALEVSLVDLPEIEGIHSVGAEEIAAAAERFAARHNTRQLEGRWVAYGLIPRFADSPVGEWEDGLRGIEGVLTRQLPADIQARTVGQGWEGWELVADLPFAIPPGSLVEATEVGIVVLTPGATRIIGSDGSVTTTDGPPLVVSTSGIEFSPVTALAAKNSLVLIDFIEGTTWIFDVQSLAWREADAKPTQGDIHGGRLLGAAHIDGDLFVVDAASRTGAAISSTAALNLDTGTWRPIEAVPSPISEGGVTTDGQSVIVAGTRQDTDNNIIGDRNPVVYQYTDADGWDQLPSITIDGQSSTVGWVDGTGLIAWNYDLESAHLDESGSWRSLGAVPILSGECRPRGLPTRGTVVANGCGGVAWFDPGSQTWTRVWIPSPDNWDARFAVTETQAIGLWEVARNQTLMLSYRLPPRSG